MAASPSATATMRPETSTAPSCGGTLWSTGEQLRNARDPAIIQRLQPGGPLIVDGLQGNAVPLLRPQNEPPFAAYFIDYDDRFDDPQTRGHLGDVVIWRVCAQARVAAADTGRDRMPGRPVQCRWCLLGRARLSARHGVRERLLRLPRLSAELCAYPRPVRAAADELQGARDLRQHAYSGSLRGAEVSARPCRGPAKNRARRRGYFAAERRRERRHPAATAGGELPRRTGHDQ